MSRLLRMFHNDESGQDLVEYSLVLIAVATAAVAGNAALSTDFANWMGALNTRIATMITG